MATNSAIRKPAAPAQPTGLEILAGLVESGMAIVAAGKVDVRESFTAEIPNAILTRDELPQLDAVLAPLTTGEADFIAAHRKLVNTLRGVAIIGGDEMREISAWASNHFENHKVGETKARKGSAGSLAVAVEKGIIDLGIDRETSQRMAVSGKNADDGAFKIACEKAKSLMAQLAKLRPALSEGFSEEKIGEFDNWVLDGDQYQRA